MLNKGILIDDRKEPIKKERVKREGINREMGAMGANMKNLVMPIIIGIIFCMLFGYTDKGQRSVVHYQRVVEYN